MAIALIRGAMGVPAPTPDDSLDEAEAAEASNDAALATGLAKYIRDAFQAARESRQQTGVDNDLISALRAQRGQYSPEKLAEIRKTQSSDVYLRISANKIRGVAAGLRDVYTSAERPWGITPTSDPEMPVDDETESLIQQVMANELRQAAMDSAASGVPMQITPQMLFNRRRDLRDMLYQHKMQDASKAMDQREDAMDAILRKGGFYSALWDFLLDIATFPYAVIKGPVVYYRPQLVWKDGKATVKTVPTMTWERCSPFDVYFAPWSQSAQDGYIIHRQRCTRSALQSLIGLPAYNTAAITEILDRSPDAFRSWFSYTEYEQAAQEQRESDANHTSSTDAVDRPFPMLEFHGSVSGALLLDWGMQKSKVPDATKDLNITGWLIDDKVIGVRVNPHPMGTKPFYVDSFERVPGSIYGLGVPKMIEDVSEAGCATLRALVNNMAISSGPQVAVDESRLDADEKDLSMYPWKVWPFTNDATGTGSGVPVSFFQPSSNATELLGVLKAFMEFADTFSSMPQFMQGNPQGMSTIGRTSSGLSMLMDAANRTMKQSVTSIDKNVIEPAISDLNVYLALTRSDIVDDGDINVVAKGATQLVQRDQLRMRRAQFLQVTNNPIDLNVVGPQFRAELITEMAKDLQIPTDSIGKGVTSFAPPQVGANLGQMAQGKQGPQATPQGVPTGAMGGQPGPAPMPPTPSSPAPQPAEPPAQPAADNAAPPKA